MAEKVTREGGRVEMSVDDSNTALGVGSGGPESVGKVFGQLANKESRGTDDGLARVREIVSWHEGGVANGNRRLVRGTGFVGRVSYVVGHGIGNNSAEMGLGWGVEDERLMRFDPGDYVTLAKEDSGRKVKRLVVVSGPDELSWKILMEHKGTWVGANG